MYFICQMYVSWVKCVSKLEIDGEGEGEGEEGEKK